MKSVNLAIIIVCGLILSIVGFLIFQVFYLISQTNEFINSAKEVIYFTKNTDKMFYSWVPRSKTTETNVERFRKNNDKRY